ncbi:MAG: hypothetical protein GY714_29740, partial [Desulfobacterales bacterium]|nr:hypothetical protein [Desulfobacterales bacterium]
MSSKRENKPPKRQLSSALPQSNSSEPIPKKIRDNQSQAIPQKSTEKEKNDFRAESINSLEKLQLLKHFLIVRNNR